MSEAQAEVVEATADVAEKPVVEGKMAEFIDWVEGISVLELSALVKALEDRLGVSAAAPMAMAVAGGDGGGEAAQRVSGPELAVLGAAAVPIG